MEELGGPNPLTDTRQLLERVCANYNLKTAAYFGLNVSRNDPSAPYLAVTYSSAWVEHYKARNYVNLDPVIKSGFASLLPIEWSGKRVTTPKLKQFFGEATEFGVGQSGLTVPVRGPSGDRALVTITSDAPLHVWQRELPRLKRDFQMLAYHLHQTVIRTQGLDKPIPKLAPREIECLKWKASGKTDWETGMILGISEKTVRFYLDLARAKLNASNVTHAVAKALNQNLFLVSQ